MEIKRNPEFETFEFGPPKSMIMSTNELAGTRLSCLLFLMAIAIVGSIIFLRIRIAHAPVLPEQCTEVLMCMEETKENQ